MSRFQKRVIRILETNVHHSMEMWVIARFLKTSNLAVYSAMLSLQKQGKVVVTRNRPDQWGVLTLSLPWARRLELQTAGQETE